MSVVIKPSSCFPNGMSYEFFLESFCYRCKKGKINSDGYAESPENGGCEIWDAMENARFDRELYPCNDVVQIEKNGEVMYWNVCKHFESSDKQLMKQYKMLFESEVVENGAAQI